jgi:pimeloyl-ACP methyl ester carboxylesterase
LKPSRSEFHTFNGVRYHVRLWGGLARQKIFLLHGWMDVAASFQFLADSLSADWCVIAPDWRGFGLSSWAGPSYYFPDYLADLNALLGHYEPNRAVNLVGHSMGGNVAGLYAGVRPERVARLALLEGFGLSAAAAEQAPERYAKWLAQLAARPAFKTYASYDELARRLQHNNPRLPFEKALFLARHCAHETAPGRIELLSDPGHKLTNPVLYRIDEAKACWRQVSAPVLWVVGADSELLKKFQHHPDEYTARKACFAQFREHVIQDAGHMLHHDQPEKLAALLEEFLGAA